MSGEHFIPHPNSVHGLHSDSQVDDMDVDLDKEFLQDLKELKVLVADKDLLDLHKRLLGAAMGWGLKRGPRQL